MRLLCGSLPAAGFCILSANQPQQARGETHHAHKATAERVAGGSIALGRWLIVLAIIALALAFLWR